MFGNQLVLNGPSKLKKRPADTEQKKTASAPFTLLHLKFQVFKVMAFHFRLNSMFHFTLYFAQSILHFVLVIWVCTRDLTVLHSTFNFDLCSIQVFAFDIQLFISSSQVFEFDLQVQWNVHSLFRIRHLTFVLYVFAFHTRLWTLYSSFVWNVHSLFRIRHLTFVL